MVKAGLSAWIDQTFRQLDNFSWQQGDGAFSVSVSQWPETIHLPLAKIMRTSTKLSDCGPSIGMLLASVCYTSDLAPFQLEFQDGIQTNRPLMGAGVLIERRGAVQ